MTMSTLHARADLTRGFDVMRGSKAIAHFDTYAEAAEYAAHTRNAYIRYWLTKE